MQRATILLVLALVVSGPAPAGADTGRLSLGLLPRLVLEHDAGAAMAAQSALLALHSYKGTVAEALPQIDFSTTYSLSYIPWAQTQSYYFTSTYPWINVEDLTTTDQGTHQLSSKLSLSQLLPTAGSLYLGLEDVMSIDTTGSQTITGGTLTNPAATFSQRPRVSFSLNQPLFLNGKLLDMDLFPATQRKAELGYLEQDAATLSQRNQTLGQALQLYFTIVQLRKSVAQTARSLEVTRGNLSTLEKNFTLGAVAEEDLLDSRLGLSRQKQSLLELQSSLARSERQLGHSIGTTDVAALEIAEEVPDLRFPFGREEILRKAMSSHPLIRQKGLVAEERRLDEIIAGQQFASTLNLSFSWSPRYPYDSSNSPYMTDFPGSFADLFKTGSGHDYSLSAGITIHLFDGGKAEENRAGNTALGASAEQGLSAQRQAVEEQVEIGLLQMASLQEKIDLLVDAARLAQRRLATEQNLLALGRSTDLLVESKAADADARAHELWRARADLYLTVIDLYSLGGEDIARIIEGSAP